MLRQLGRIVLSLPIASYYFPGSQTRPQTAAGCKPAATWVCLRVGVFTCGVFAWVCLRGCVYVGVFTCGCVYVRVFTWLQTRSNVALPLAHVLPHVLSHVPSHVPSHVLIHVLIHVQAGMLPACFRLRVCNPRSLSLPALFPKNVRQQDAAPAGSHCSFTPYRFLLLSRVADPATDGCGLQTRSNVGVFTWVCLRVGVYVVANPQQRGAPSLPRSLPRSHPRSLPRSHPRSGGYATRLLSFAGL